MSVHAGGVARECRCIHLGLNYAPSVHRTLDGCVVRRETPALSERIYWDIRRETNGHLFGLIPLNSKESNMISSWDDVVASVFSR